MAEDIPRPYRTAGPCAGQAAGEGTVTADRGISAFAKIGAAWSSSGEAPAILLNIAAIVDMMIGRKRFGQA